MGSLLRRKDVDKFSRLVNRLCKMITNSTLIEEGRRVNVRRGIGQCPDLRQDKAMFDTYGCTSHSNDKVVVICDPAQVYWGIRFANSLEVRSSDMLVDYDAASSFSCLTKASVPIMYCHL